MHQKTVQINYFSFVITIEIYSVRFIFFSLLFLFIIVLLHQLILYLTTPDCPSINQHFYLQQRNKYNEFIICQMLTNRNIYKYICYA